MAYLNFQNCTRQEYENVLYSQDAKNKIKIFFNNVELENADRYCEKFTVKPRIMPNGAKIFSLNNFVSKEAELILHDIDLNIIKDQVSISIGTLVNNVYEYVPIGIFNIQDQPTNDKNKTTIKLRDNSVKFDFNYNAQPLIEENGGSATKLQILQDICTQASVTCNITSFIGYLDEIGIYDNTITARQYIANIAEQAGKIATINRNGELIFIDLNNLTTWEIPLDIVEKYENGAKFKIGKVVYEDGVVRYETPDSNDDTLFLDSSNTYINGENVKSEENSNENSYYLEDSSNAELMDFQLEGKTTQETTTGKNLINPYSTNIGTSNGITTTYNSNQSLTFSGTTTSTWAYLTNQYSTGKIDLVSSSGNYTFSINKASSVYTTIIRLFYNSSNYQDITIQKNTTSRTANITNGIVAYQIYISGYTSGTTINDTLFFQLEKGSTATEYEQYGVSPSPDYPSELVSVGYENLFDKDNYNLYNGYFNNNTITANAGNDIFYIDCKPSTTYNVSKTPSINYAIAYSTVLPTANITLYGKVSANNQASATITTGNDAKYLVIWARNGNIGGEITRQQVLDTLQITKSTQPHTYIPYGKYGIEVKTTGKNLLDGNFELGYININTGINASGSTQIRTKNYIKINNNTQYTISGETQKDRWGIFYDKNGAYLSYLQLTSNNTKGTFTTPNNAYYLRYYIPAYTDINAKEQLEKGNIATIYEECKSNTYLYTLDNPLRSIGNTKDLLYIKNGILYVDRKIGSRILNGSESWGTIGDNRYWVAFPDKRGLTSAVPCMLKSNYFKTTNNAGDTVNVGYFTEGYYTIANYNVFFNYNGVNNDMAGFKTWLSTHNTEVQYILAEPYTEALGQVDMPSTYEDVTYIDIFSNINTYSYLKYSTNKSQVEAILEQVNQFSIDSFRTGMILGNPAIDGYDLIQITDNNKIFKTLATSELIYNGVLINKFDTQIGEEAKEKNVFINGDATFKKWAKTSIDNVKGDITLQAGEIDETKGLINQTSLQISSQGALLNVLANKSNINVNYDNEGNPIDGNVTEVTTTTGFTFNAEGMTIQDSETNFKALHRNTGTYYKEGDSIVGQYTKDGSKQKDLELFGVYYYGKNDFPDTPMFIAQLYTDENGEECFGHFYNRGD